MKPIRLAALAAAAALTAAQPVHAQYSEGGYYLAERLAALCMADGAAERDRCQTYIVGVTDSVMYDWAETLCVPDKTTPAQLRELFLKHYVIDNGYHPAAIEIRAALQAAYPCPPPR